jgi:hypothetical protein
MAAIDDVFKHFVSTKKLKVKDSSVFVGWVSRQQAFFIRRRAEAIAAIVPAWIAAANQPDLRARLDAEFTALEGFLTAQVGRGSTKGPLLPVLGGNATLDKTPNHLDLKDLAQRRTGESATGKTVKSRAEKLSWARLIKVNGIVWRAAALHPEIWTDVPGPGHTAATLAPDVLNEILDRRLHSLERMQYQVSSRGDERDDDFLGAGALGWGKAFKDQGTGAYGPWKDTFRVRLFEYPRIGGKTADLLAKIDPGNTGRIADPDTEKYLEHVHDDPSHATATPPSDHRHWEWNSSAKVRLEWRVVHGSVNLTRAKAEFRFPAVLHDDWKASPAKQYYIGLQPIAPRTGAQAIDQLFDHTRPVTDWWQRSWLWCDHTIAALHIEALLFALRRRLGVVPGTDRFNKLVTGTAPPDIPAGGIAPYVMLAPCVGITEPPDRKFLLSHTASPHFRNQLTTDDDLELGDHIIFWNHTMYGLLTKGDWRNENSLVMSLDVDPATGMTKRSTLRLQGHGVPVRLYAGFQREIADKIEGGLLAAQRDLISKAAASPATVAFRRAKIVRWMPYPGINRVKTPSGTIVSIQPYWIEIPRDSTEVEDPGTGVPDHLAAITAVYPKTFAHRTSPAAGYTVPPRTDAVYFPLFEPKFAVDLLAGGKASGWEAAFLWHEARATLKSPPSTRPSLMAFVAMSGELIPGLELRPDKKYTCVRPIPLP